VVDPVQTKTVYAAVGAQRGAATNGVYKSTDSGSTWSLLAAAPKGLTAGRIYIGISKANSQVIYVIASGTGLKGSTTFGTLYKIMRSDNGGSTFTDLTTGTPNFMGEQGWYDAFVAVDPSNAAIVYVAGSAGPNSILRSTDSGATWKDISSGGATPHADHHAGVFDASGRLLDGDDGGIYRLDNPTAPSWTDLNGNLDTIQFEGIGLHPTDSTKAIGGSQDNGTEIYAGNVLWTETDGGDGGFAKISQTNASRAYHQIPVESFGSNFFRRSDDGGKTWTTKTAGIVADKDHQNFYAPFVVYRANGDPVLYGTYNVWETVNGGDTWTTLSTVGKNGWNPAGANVSAIGYAPSTNQTIYAATFSPSLGQGRIFVTTNHGAAWTERSISGLPRVVDLQVDVFNPQIVYAAIGAFNSAGTVFRSLNGGATWTSISGNLVNQPAWSLQIGADGTLYLGADDGVYVEGSPQGGEDIWDRFSSGLPKAQVFQLEINPNLQLLLAGTHGRSAWEISLGSATASQ
jgi:hypothetical protein